MAVLHQALLGLASFSDAFNIFALVLLTSALAILESLSKFILGDSERQVESSSHPLRYLFPLSFYA